MDNLQDIIDSVTKQNDLHNALVFTLKWEGGYVNNSSDPGGETKWGISKRAYPNLDIKNLTREQALGIYAKDYWLAAGCDELPWPYNAVVFDTAVNCGVGRARLWVRTSTNMEEFLDHRKEHYQTLLDKNPKLETFAKGWWARFNDLEKFVDINEDSST